jgi:hypothetical protein
VVCPLFSTPDLWPSTPIQSPPRPSPDKRNAGSYSHFQDGCSLAAANSADGSTVASRTRPWLVAGWASRHRHLSTVQRNPDTQFLLSWYRPTWHTRGQVLGAREICFRSKVDGIEPDQIAASEFIRCCRSQRLNCLDAVSTSQIPGFEDRETQSAPSVFTIFATPSTRGPSFRNAIAFPQ